MAESDLFPLDPDYVIAETIDPGVSRQRAQSGLDFQRVVRAPQRLFELVLESRTTDQVEQVRDWHARFQQLFFRFDYKVYINNAGTYLTRSFPVIFAGEPEYDLVANEVWNMRVRLLEAAGRPLPGGSGFYPDPALGHPSYFKEESHADAVVLAGTWTATADANAHAGNHKTNPNTNATDAFQWTYAGYGFRVWAIKASNLGIFKVYLDAANLGTVDLYSATTLASAAVFTKLDVQLGLHRVKIEATNTKNAASSANTIVADALDVIP